MRWLGQVFPVLLIVLGVLWTAMAIADELAGSGWAIAASIAFGSVLMASRMRPDR